VPADSGTVTVRAKDGRPNMIDGFKGWKEGTKKKSFDVAFLIHGRIVKQI
jgi:hypothetical protein